ncbi:unnamed protein product [Miscanthus lutarioriparius]|uniref:At1g61320/AtMIF1 LRR domain-containing protein n=1 Tax=Miscanthus lutarioriparius TaxID=422564 RepID=A0A811MLJ7_9POAL|nr:unnamed protein product [Miscanthus lutarioriparius]
MATRSFAQHPAGRFASPHPGLGVRREVRRSHGRAVQAMAARVDLCDYAQQLALLLDTQVRPGADPGQFVDWVLAQRGDADIGSLNISMSSRSSLVYTSQEKVNGWLRYAMQRVVKSFRLDLPNPRHIMFRPWPPLRVDGPAVVLPDRGRMTSIEMFLPSCYSFQLPVAASAKYEALTDLTLCSASFFDGESSAGGGRTLGDFVSSSCCPRLRKLEISSIKGLAQLAIRSETLERFELESANDLRVLDVTAPNLRVLELHDDCFDDESNNKIRIVSFRLQETRIRHESRRRRSDLVIHNLTSVCRLDLELNMHGQYYVRSTGIGFWLLEKCPSVEHVRVWLDHLRSPPSSVIEGDTIADFTLEGVAPFASVRSMDMTVRAHQFQDYQLVTSIFALLLRCPRLRSLRINIKDDTTNKFL